MVLIAFFPINYLHIKRMAAAYYSSLYGIVNTTLGRRGGGGVNRRTGLCGSIYSDDVGLDC